MKYFSSDITIDILSDSGSIIEYKNYINDPWYINYNAARNYFETYGNLNVKKGYKTEDGLNLAQWLAYQRQSRKGNNSSILSDEQINMLSEIGMIWDKNEFRWEQGYEIACEFYKEFGHLEVKQDLIYMEYKLGKWINMQRLAYNSDSSRKNLSQIQINRLEKIGMIWHADELNWNRAFEYAKEFYEEYGHFNIPRNYSVGKWNVGYWLKNQKTADKKKTLREDRKEKLVKIGFN